MAATHFSGPLVVTGEVDSAGNVVQPTLTNVASQIALQGGVSSKVVPGSTSLSLRNNADSQDNLIITDAGNATLRGALTTTGASGGQGGAAGSAGSVQSLVKTVTALVDTVATTVLTATVPNANHSGVIRVLLRCALTASAHTYDSTRVVEVFVAISRVAGAALGSGISAAVGAQIATVSAGRTLTVAATLVNAGGATASNTVAVQVACTASNAGDTTEVQVFAELLNAAATGITIA